VVCAARRFDSRIGNAGPTYLSNQQHAAAAEEGKQHKKKEKVRRGGIRSSGRHICRGDNEICVRQTLPC
jgi:hypothetical protein